MEDDVILKSTYFKSHGFCNAESNWTGYLLVRTSTYALFHRFVRDLKVYFNWGMAERYKKYVETRPYGGRNCPFPPDLNRVNPFVKKLLSCVSSFLLVPPSMRLNSNSIFTIYLSRIRLLSAPMKRICISSRKITFNQSTYLCIHASVSTQ